ncbi:MAG: ABC transporter ATP-binding protein [Rhodospirillaceae bacterium]
MSSDTTPVAAPVVVAKDVAKSYTLYPRPSDRLAHLFMPWRKYPAFEALKGVSFTVGRGETVGIIGQNGAGKSTLLQVVTGTITPSSGDVKVSGRVAALLELGAGFEPDFTGRENIVLNGTILGLSSKELKERTEEIIAFSELGPFIDRPVRTYSSGMFMRLAFSVAAHVDADLLIIDEALSVGDVRFTQKCLRFLKDFKQRGSILFVSHDLGSVTGLCDKAIWLDHGRVRAEGPAIKICEQYVASLFEGAVADAPAAPAQNQPAQAVSGEIVLMDEEAPPRASKPGATSVSAFNADGSSFGSGGAAIIDAGLFSPADGHRFTQVVEGQDVDLKVLIKADVTVERPIMGFYVKDRLGQFLLGDNSYWDTVPQPPIPAGERLAFRFRFRWPALARGTYTLTVGFADGTMEHHIQRHWIHDAVIFEVLSSSARLAMVGVQLRRVLADRNPPE